MNRPNRVTIIRRDVSGRSATRSVLTRDDPLNSDVPALLQGARGALTTIAVEGKDYVQDALLILDGLAPAAYRGVAPNGTVVVDGITYTVLANGRGAFPALAPNDVIVDESGLRSLVLAVNHYLFTRTLQAQVARGRAWS
jgi:hypothetical protein